MTGGFPAAACGCMAKGELAGSGAGANGDAAPGQMGALGRLQNSRPRACGQVIGCVALQMRPGEWSTLHRWDHQWARLAGFAHFVAKAGLKGEPRMGNYIADKDSIGTPTQMHLSSQIVRTGI